MDFKESSTNTAKKPLLSIARLNRCSRALGPGNRAVIWTHGCSKHCPECIAKDMNEAPPLFYHSAESLYAWVKSCNEIEGITISGGEPFEQNLPEMRSFLELVKHDPRDLSVLCYTGRLLSELQDDDSTKAVLELIDILIDGPYIPELNDGHKWRGSANQNVHVLNKSFQTPFANIVNEFDRTIEVNLDKNLKMEITGIPPKDFIKRLDKRLEASGYSLSF